MFSPFTAGSQSFFSFFQQFIKSLNKYIGRLCTQTTVYAWEEEEMYEALTQFTLFPSMRQAVNDLVVHTGALGFIKIFIMLRVWAKKRKENCKAIILSLVEVDFQ